MLEVVEKPIIWTENVSKAWDLPERLTVSEWADRCRVLGQENAEPGRWNTDRTPYLRGIMDAFNDPNVEDITIMKSTQLGGTEAMLNMLGYIVDQDPGPTLYVMPREPDAKSFSAKRILPMLQLSDALSQHLTKNTDDLSRLELTLSRMTIYLAGANSPAALSSRPIKNLLFDETDKYPTFSGKEADPIELATERTKTFWNRKICKASTPTTESGYINREYQLSDRRQYFVPCPHCGKMQALVWHQVKFPKDVRDPEEILARRLAYYECIKCHGVITDQMKHKMLLNGRWIPEQFQHQADDMTKTFPFKNRAGFWINAIYSPWVTFSEMVAKWLKAQGRRELLMNFTNSWLAEPWREHFGINKPDQLRKLAMEYEAGTVPEKAICLTAGVDVQQDHLVATIRAWGYFQESWQILSVRVEHWQDLARLLFINKYPSVNPQVEPFAVALTCLDTGHRTSEAYEFVREWFGLVKAIKGHDTLRGIPYKTNNIDKFPDGRVMPGGLQLYHLDTAYFKDKIYRMVHNTSGGLAGGWHLHKDPSEDYLNQFCGEAKVTVEDKKTKRVHEEWRKVSSSAKNNFFDTEVYATAAAEILRVFDLRPEQMNTPRQQERGREKAEDSWINVDTSNWMKR